MQNESNKPTLTPKGFAPEILLAEWASTIERIEWYNKLIAHNIDHLKTLKNEIQDFLQFEGLTEEL